MKADTNSNFEFAEILENFIIPKSIQINVDSDNLE